MVRTIFTYASDVWHDPTKVQDFDNKYKAMKSIEYKALRKITGGYHGSNHLKLAAIAAVEPLERKLDNISVAWFARSIRTGDRHIREFLEAPTAPNFHRWDDGKDLYSRDPATDLDSPICAAARLSATDGNQLSYGNRDHTHATPAGTLTDMTIMDSREERSKARGPWLATIGALMENGWRTAYSDGSGAEGHAAGAACLMSRRAEPTTTMSHYLGTKATSNDAGLQGILCSLQLVGDMDQILLLSDSQAGVASMLNLAKGDTAPRSGIERAIKRMLASRGQQNLDTGISWIRAHIGIPGNEAADREAGLKSFVGQILRQELTATEGGIRQATKAARASYRSVPSLGLGQVVQRH